MATTKKSTKKAAVKRAAVKKATEPRVANRSRKNEGPEGTASRFRALCLSFPESTEVEAWGHPTFRVRDKIFASCGGYDGALTIGFKTTHEMQAGLVASDPRFAIAKYVGKHGWVEMRIDEGEAIDWSEVRALVAGSYALIVPKALAARVEE